MNEASSKYVDHIAVDRLLTEKLNKVHHYAKENISIADVDLGELDNILTSELNFSMNNHNSPGEISFGSYVKSGYSSNDTCRCLFYKSNCENIVGDLIFVHGLYEDNIQIYNYFISQLNEKGINVYLLMLPFHYDRKPDDSLFSGELFWSGDIDRSVLAFKQSIFDIYSLISYLKNNSNRVILSGFSMGGGIALTLASKVNLDGVFVINPVSNITSLVWTSKLFSPVKADFEYAGLDFNKVRDRFKEFEPLDREKLATEVNRIAVGLSIYDQINNPANYDMLIKKWSMNNVYKYKAGHLNILRVPKLANDIEKLFFS
jgi:esterase/lipase